MNARDFSDVLAQTISGEGDEQWADLWFDNQHREASRTAVRVLKLLADPEQREAILDVMGLEVGYRRPDDGALMVWPRPKEEDA